MENKRTIIHEMDTLRLPGRKKTVRVFLPYDYETSKNRYPVLYMLDGQNLVDPAKYSGYSWNVRVIADELQKKGTIQGLLIVGIDSDPVYRINEYSHSIHRRYHRWLEKDLKMVDFKPEAKEFEAFLIEEVKPFIDSNYRTIPEENGVAGSSCGGNISLTFAVNYPNVFRVVGAFSPASGIVWETLGPQLRHFEIPDTMRLYHDMGSKEGVGMVFMERKIDRILHENARNPENIRFVLDKGGRHTELFWQARFQGFLEWAYKIAK